MFNLYTYLFIAWGLIRSNYDDYTFVPLTFISVLARRWIRSNYDNYTFVSLIYISVFGQGVDEK